MKNKLVNEITSLVLLSVLSYSFLSNFEYWNNAVFKFVVFGYTVKTANIISYKNIDEAGYGYSDMNIQLVDELSNYHLKIKSFWLNTEDQTIRVYVNDKYPELITCKSNFIFDVSIFAALFIGFVLWIKYGFNFLKKRVIM